jgi:teichuronic acid biosynthesis glycosyltransferase TuaG
MIELDDALVAESSSLPGVSVLIPFYKADRYFPEALESVLRQTWPALEILAVVDGEAAARRGYFEKFAHERLKVEVLPENRGAAAARNRGLALARGEFVAFLDADDIWLVDKLQRQLQFMQENPDCNACHTGVAVFNEAGDTVASYTNKPAWLSSEDLLKGGSQVPPSSFLIQRELLVAAGGFDENYRTSEDFELTLRLLRMGARIGFLPDPLTRLRRAEHGNLSSNGLLLLRNHLRIAFQYRESIARLGGPGAFARFVGRYLYADGARIKGWRGKVLRVFGRLMGWIGGNRAGV